MNHCLLEANVQEAPTIRYTKDNQTPIAEMGVVFEGLRPEDPKGFLKVVGWGNIAQELQSNVKPGQKLILEGRLRMNTIPRQDGTKEKKAEFTLSRFHKIHKDGQQDTKSNNTLNSSPHHSTNADNTPLNSSQAISTQDDSVNWNSSPLIPNTDEIPF